MRIKVLKDYQLSPGKTLRKGDTPLVTGQLAKEVIESGHAEPFEMDKEMVQNFNEVKFQGKDKVSVPKIKKTKSKKIRN